MQEPEEQGEGGFVPALLSYPHVPEITSTSPRQTVLYKQFKQKL